MAQVMFQGKPDKKMRMQESCPLWDKDAPQSSKAVSDILFGWGLSKFTMRMETRA